MRIKKTFLAHMLTLPIFVTTIRKVSALKLLIQKEGKGGRGCGRGEAKGVGGVNMNAARLEKNINVKKTSQKSLK